jgi:hypothetical protein
MILQALGVVGGFASEGYVETASGRVIGFTGGPWEVGVVINFCFAILLRRKSVKPSPLWNFGLFLFTFLFLIPTAARMPILAHICIYAFFLIGSARRPKLVMLTAIATGLTLLAIILAVPNPVQARSADLLSGENFRAFSRVYSNITPSKEVSGVPWEDSGEDAEESEGVDMSWALRLIKWIYMLKLWLATPTAWLIGLGPGISGPALDGAWLRILIETGLLGLVAFAILLVSLARVDSVMAGLVTAMAINMIMIDVHIAYKAMSVFFYSAGYCYRKRLDLRDANSITDV